MDAPVDFSLDRARLLNGNLGSSSIGSYAGVNYSEGVSSLSRNATSSIGGVPSIPDMARVATPASLSQAELQSRYLHSSLPLSSQGASYAAMMNNYLSGREPASEHLKTLMPDLQQYYSSHGEGSFPRYIINNNSLFPTYLPYLPGAAESLSMFAQSTTPSAYHRMYDLHKEAALYHGISSSGIYGPLSPGQSSRISSDYSSSTRELSSHPAESKRTLDLSKDSRHTESKRSLDLSKETSGRHIDSKRSLDLTKHSDTKKISDSSKQNDSKRLIDLSKHVETKKSGDADPSDARRQEAKKHNLNKKDLSRNNDTKQCKITTVKDGGDQDKRNQTTSEENSDVSDKQCSVQRKLSHYEKDFKGMKEKGKCSDNNGSDRKKTKVNEVIKRSLETNNDCPTKSKKSKIEKQTDENAAKEKIKLKNKNESEKKETSEKEQTDDDDRHVVPDITTTAHTSIMSTSPVSSSCINGTSTDSILSGKSSVSTTNTTFSIPYYHSIYSHSISTGVTDKMKIRAPTFTPEIVTLPSVVSLASLPVQTMACDMRIKKEMSSYSNSKLSPTSTVNTGKCQVSPQIHSRAKDYEIQEPLALISKENKRKDKQDIKADICKDKMSDEVNIKEGNPRKSVCDTTSNVACKNKQTKAISKTESNDKDDDQRKLRENESHSTELSSSLEKDKCKSSIASTHARGIDKNKTDENCRVQNPESSEISDKQSSDVINLSKVTVKQVPEVSSFPNDTVISQKDTGKSDKPIYRKTEFPVVKRRSDKILASKENKKDSQRREDGHTGMNNIPVGIAVAQKRQESTHAESIVCTSVSSFSTSNDTSPSRLLSDGAAVKSCTSVAPPTDIRNQLPANLIVTGSANGSGVAWADDPSARQFSSPWLQPGHPMNANPWINQMPFTLNPSIPTTDTEQLPFSVPPGYKLVQDSVTGQLLFLPTTNFDMYDPNRLWNYPAGHHTQFQQMIAAHQSTTLQHPVLSQERQATDYPMAIQQFQPFHQMACQDNSVEMKPLPLLHQKTQEKTSNENGCKEGKKVSESAKVAVVKSTNKLNLKEEDPISCSVNELDNTIQNKENNDTASLVTKSAKTELVQSRGTSPMVPASECEEPQSGAINSPVHPKEETILETSTADHNVASVQTVSVKQKVSDNVTQSSDVTPICCEAEKEVEICDKEKVEDKKEKYKFNIEDLPRTTVIDNVTIVELTHPKQPLVTSSECKSDLKDNSAASEKSDDVIPDKSPLNSSPQDSESTIAYVSYNPFLDPQILQAADGLELLSALAEQRSKCVDTEKTVAKDAGDKKQENQENQKLFRETKVEGKEGKKTNIKPKRKTSISRTRSIPPPKPKVETGSYYTSTGLRIPQDLDSFLEIGDEEINAIELDMRIRLAELQRQYKEKQKQLSKLQPKKDKTRENEKDDVSKQRGPGRPRKRTHNSGSSQDSPPTKTVTKLNMKKGKDATVKKKKPAEELVDRVFRKTGGGFGMPLSKKLKANAMAALFKTQSGFTMKRKSSSSSNHSPNSGKGLGFGGAKVVKSCEQKPGENIGKNLFESFSSGLGKQKTSNVIDSHKKSSTENSLGVLAKYAAREQSDRAPQKATKQKHEDDEECKSKERDIYNNQNDSSSITNHHVQITAKRDSDLDSSWDGCSSGHKKRKPGRPRKYTPDQSKTGTETIVDKHSKNFRLYQLQNFNDQWNSTSSSVNIPQSDKTQKVESSPAVTKPLFLDEEWMLRRSERIFLSDPSPQPSPNFSTTSTSSNKSKQSSASGQAKTKSEDAKLQKARNIQELSQKVKKKYSMNFKRSKSSDSAQKAKKQKNKIKAPISKETIESENESSESEADNIPLSVLRERPSTPEPRSCAISVDELKDDLRVLVFRDGLFYEGAVKGIRPPDVYGVVVDNARGNRPYIYSQEEILRDVIVDVRPSSSRFLKEGTRLCAYWSQQFSCLYPGTVAKASPNPHYDKSFVNVEFDDGDSGRIPMDHIRLLPQDFPLVSYDPNPLLLIGKRRRHTTSDFTDHKNAEQMDTTETKPKSKRGPGRPPKSRQESSRIREDDDEDIDVCGLDDDNDDVFPGKCGSGSYQSYGRSKSTNESEKKKSKHKDKERIYRSSESDQEQGKMSLIGLFKIPKDVRVPNAKKMKKIKHRDGYNYFRNNEGYSDCRLHEQIPPLDDEYADDVNSYGDMNGPLVHKTKKKRQTNYEHRLAAFLPARQLWCWSGKSTKRPGMKGKAKKEFYRSIVRGREVLSIGDCAVFLSSGRPNLPFVGRIDSMWEAWGGQMVVKVKWFYHPEETKGGKKLQDMKGALFQSPHIDENDVQTISHKCELLSYTDYRKRRSQGTLPSDDTDVYYLAGTYEPTIGLLKFEDDIM